MKTLRPRTSASPTAPKPSSTPGSSGKRRRGAGCGECAACTREDCRQCVYCKDMRKYGGPNKLRKRCALRKCELKEGGDEYNKEVKKEKMETKRSVAAPAVEEPVQTTKSKRVIKQPKKLAPNHSAALSYDDNVGGEETRPSPPAPAPPSKRRKLDSIVPPKKVTDAKSYGSGKRLGPPPSRPTRVPSPPDLTPPPSPKVTRVTRRAVRPAPRNTRRSARNKKKKFVPKSLPFLVGTDIGDVIVRYEIRARNIAVQDSKDEHDGKENGRNDWKLEEVINFFRGVYLFGWGDWSKVQQMIKTRTVLQIENFAASKLQRYPELKRFFGRNNLHNLHTSFSDEKIKRLASVVPVPATASLVDPAATGWKTNVDQGLGNLSQAALEFLEDEEEAKEEEETVRIAEKAKEKQRPKKPGWLKDSVPPFLIRPMDPTRGTFSNGKVAICLGDRVIEADKENVADAELSNLSKTDSPSKTDVFDPKYRPSAPTANSQQIYIPGNRVYARWLNAEDPGSYGTWYPGFVHSSSVSPDQKDYDDGICKFPCLVYQIRFDDGVLSEDIKAEDIMMQNQYETWLEELEEYYYLPMPAESAKECLSGGQRIHAKWIDPTDPDMHARWVPGVIVACNGLTEDGTFTYHVKFDDGDDDEDLSSEYVLEDSIYNELLQQKIEHGRVPHVSGIDLIHAASKISSPIKDSLYVSKNGSSGGAFISDLNDDRDDDKSYATVESELLCHEELDPMSPLPHSSNDSDAPGLHYGLYMKMKPGVITPSIERSKKIAVSEKPSLCADVDLGEPTPNITETSANGHNQLSSGSNDVQNGDDKTNVPPNGSKASDHAYTVSNVALNDLNLSDFGRIGEGAALNSPVEHSENNKSLSQSSHAYQ